MQLPKKISPIDIREAVVEIRYDSNLPFEVLVGLFFNALDDTYTYTHRLPQQQQGTQALPANPGQELTIRVGSSSIFYNQNISLQLLPNSLVFTWLHQYTTWADYFPEIEKTLGQLMTTGHFEKIIRVGVRYISEYPEKDLRDCINFTFSFGLPEIDSDTTAFRSEFIRDGTRIILNLNNRVPILKPNPTNKQVESIRTSIIDIDVIREGLTIVSLEELLNVINDNHTEEKKIFFGMIKKEYLESLKPEY